MGTNRAGYSQVDLFDVTLHIDYNGIKFVVISDIDRLVTRDNIVPTDISPDSLFTQGLDSRQPCPAMLASIVTLSAWHQMLTGLNIQNRGIPTCCCCLNHPELQNPFFSVHMYILMLQKYSSATGNVVPSSLVAEISTEVCVYIFSRNTLWCPFQHAIS